MNIDKEIVATALEIRRLRFWQTGHLSSSLLPHPLQNLASSGLSCLRFWHFIESPSLLNRIGVAAPHCPHVGGKGAAINHPVGVGLPQGPILNLLSPIHGFPEQILLDAPGSAGALDVGFEILLAILVARPWPFTARHGCVQIFATIGSTLNWQVD